MCCSTMCNDQKDVASTNNRTLTLYQQTIHTVNRNKKLSMYTTYEDMASNANVGKNVNKSVY
jgi:hypothetical protein